MLLASLIFIAVALTYGMFLSRQALMGFPCLIFWALVGGQSYLQSTVPWGDIYFYLFFSSFGMAVFCVLASFALRTKKEELADGDEYIDEGKDELAFIDEGKNENKLEPLIDKYTSANEDRPSRAVRGVRERAAKRRERWD